MTGVDAIVLSGGRSARMGGPKPALDVGGVPLLARVTAALTAVETVIVVGPTVPGARADVVCREDPPGSGPVAAVAAGMRHVRAPVVLLLGADLPFLTADAVAALLQARGDADRAVAVDEAGREQPLLSVWRTAALGDALRRVGPHAGAALRGLGAETSVPVQLDGEPPPWWDCDDPDDLARARALLAEEAAMTSGERSAPTLEQWWDEVSHTLQIVSSAPPSLMTPVLDVTRDVAHGVSRPAAPLTAFLLGVAVGQGADPEVARAQIAALLP